MHDNVVKEIGNNLESLGQKLVEQQNNYKMNDNKD